MLDEAIAKIRAEMEQQADEPYIQVVGEFLVQYLEANPVAAKNISGKDKTITKSMVAMQKVAAKKKKGGCAVLTDAEGFAVVLDYFGIKSATPTASIRQPVPPAPEKNTDVFDIRLEDLL